jgi:phosphatidylinositol glycan class B
MRQLIRSFVESLDSNTTPVRFSVWLVGAAAAVHLIAAWANGGYLNADEHFQIIEFAQYKLGRATKDDLAWEFGARMRPALQPWLAAGAIRLAEAAGVVSPFIIAFALRVVSAVLSLWMSIAVCARSMAGVASQWLRRVAMSTALLFWPAPTIHARFGSETWGGALFVGGLCLMLDADEAWDERRNSGMVLGAATGLIWSASFYCRFQMAASIAGAALWVITMRRSRAPLVLVILIAFLAGAAANTAIDHWLYGEWTLTPYNYFMTNIVQGKAASFGTSPWWSVVAFFAIVLVPPYSAALIALAVAGCWYARRHMLVWVTVPFVLIHVLVAHKELRFFEPLIFVIGPLLAISFDALPGGVRGALDGWLHRRSGRRHLAALCAINLALLGASISVPANDSYRLNRWLWDFGRNGPATLFIVGAGPQSGRLRETFYEAPAVTMVPFDRGRWKAAGRVAPVYVYSRGLEPPAVVGGARGCTPVLYTFPVWLARLAPHLPEIDVRAATICRLNPSVQ